MELLMITVGATDGELMYGDSLVLYLNVTINYSNGKQTWGQVHILQLMVFGQLFEELQKFIKNPILIGISSILLHLTSNVYAVMIMHAHYCMMLIIIFQAAGSCSHWPLIK